MSLIAISPGDPAGIGPEVCLKALSKNKKNNKKIRSDWGYKPFSISE